MKVTVLFNPGPTSNYESSQLASTRTELYTDEAHHTSSKSGKHHMLKELKKTHADDLVQAKQVGPGTSLEARTRATLLRACLQYKIVCPTLPCA